MWKSLLAFGRAGQGRSEYEEVREMGGEGMRLVREMVGADGGDACERGREG